MPHRVLGVDDRHAVRLERTSELAGPGHRDERILVTVLDEHRDLLGGFPVRLEHVEAGKRGAHREHADRARPVAAAGRKGEHHPGTLGEAGDQRLRPVEPLLLAGLVEQVVERVERRGERDRVELALRAPRVPGEARGPGRLGPSGQHDGEPALRIQVGQQATEVPLVGAVPVDQEQQPLGIRAAHDVRHEGGHGKQPTIPTDPRPPPTPARPPSPMRLGINFGYQDWGTGVAAAVDLGAGGGAPRLPLGVDRGGVRAPTRSRR